MPREEGESDISIKKGIKKERATCKFLPRRKVSSKNYLFLISSPEKYGPMPLSLCRKPTDRQTTEQFARPVRHPMQIPSLPLDPISRSQKSLCRFETRCQSVGGTAAQPSRAWTLEQSRRMRSKSHLSDCSKEETRWSSGRAYLMLLFGPSQVNRATPYSIGLYKKYGGIKTWGEFMQVWFPLSVIQRVHQTYLRMTY